MEDIHNNKVEREEEINMAKTKKVNPWLVHFNG